MESIKKKSFKRWHLSHNRCVVNLFHHPSRVWRLMEVIMHVVCLRWAPDTHIQRNAVTLFLEDFTSLYPGNRERGWRRSLLFPWAPPARPEGRWKVGAILWIPSFSSHSSLPLLSVLLSLLCLIHPAVLLWKSNQKEGHSHPSPDYFLASFHSFPCIKWQFSGSMHCFHN